MTTITVILPFAKVLAAFAIILLGMKRRLGLALSILAGGWFLALVFGLSLAECLAVSGQALVEERFLLLAAIVGAILILSDALEKSGPGKVGSVLQVDGGVVRLSHRAPPAADFFPCPDRPAADAGRGGFFRADDQGGKPRHEPR